jgi:hypothetical protein
MRRRVSVLLPILFVLLSGCADLQESWEACAEVAEDVHWGKAQALCERFSGPMLETLPCDAVERVLRQTVDLVGEPVGECRWAYTYRIHGVDPLQATAIYKCPFAREEVKVTVSVEMTESGTRISGLWSDSPRLRDQPVLLRFELCREIDKQRRLFRVSGGSPTELRVDARASGRG